MMLAMERDNDALVPEWIVEETPAIAWDKLEVAAFQQIASTNEEALRRARLGAPAGTLILAESQTHGRGRQGRLWISPAGAGIYFSLIVRPERPLCDWPLLTHVAAVALATTLDALYPEGLIPHPLDVELKWPNDVLISGRKTAGILLETAAGHGDLGAAIVGVGINISPCEFPVELGGTATSIGEMAGVRVPRRRLLVDYLHHFQLAYDLFVRGDDTGILDRWKKFARMWKDTPVWIVEGARRRPAITRGITDTGALMIQTPDGAEEVIVAGDVSIRRADREEG
jgi:BirA family biotin operon repressor/biotin-[acetyl-CoA-carboxylase] ligase